MKKGILFILRLLATIAISWLLAAIYILLQRTLTLSTLTIIPAVVNEIFNFDMGELPAYLSQNTILPGWGTMSAVANSNFSARIAALIICVGTIIIFSLSIGIGNFLSKIVKGNRFLIIFSAFIFVFFYIPNVYENIWNDAYFDYIFRYAGVEKDFWYYSVSILFLVLQFIIECGIIIFLWNAEDDYQ